MRLLASIACLAAVLTIAGAVAACGGARADFAPDPTRECLRAAGVPVDTREIDLVASTADAALHVTFPDNEVTVSFGEDEADAERLERAYRRFAPSRLRRRLPDVLKRRRNAVLIWGIAPTPQYESRVDGCLSTP